MSEFINNVSRRKETLKEALRQIHAGKPYEEVKQTFAEILQQASAGEIAEIEQALIAEGLPVEDIQYLCDVHVAMFRESLDQQTPPQMMPGHPVYTFNAENELAALQLNQCRQLLGQAQDNPKAETLAQLAAALQKLAEFDCHYERKENLLFPFLEKYGFSGPSSVMWGIHDDIRKAWKSMRKQLQDAGADPSAALAAVSEKFIPMENAMREMFYKEEHILFPNALERLNASDWRAIHAQEPDFGFAFVVRGAQWPPDEQPVEIETAIGDAIINKEKQERMNEMNEFPLTTGDLTLSQINLMLTHLPVDITFVDENDIVRYFSETPTRIFKRTPAIIGRKVQNCHPPASVHKVVEIVEDFRAGKRDSAEFWIQMNGMFIHIQYFAMRDVSGNYRGTLEVSQEISALRKLEGEKRLLDD
ncbi:DUF438 domain-containing protein [Pelolinea submarina]|uniref:Hemerythrin-like domain-containing protein n=1 Tax=Pelolinea submarina TaxID=913107 RepID=A0A347ZWW3_9CHLR|nr:DUF438 domain-containing protein [Pelolinea submarina]REG05537.1 hypothetical protein DFR64_2941 [Pelolinea submarina]BBB49794.1 hypothetical protein Pelsub_P3025 [Pelolinea submarina]